MSKVIVEDKVYKVVEVLGFVQSHQAYAKVIEVDGVERVIIKKGVWIFAKPIIMLGNKPITGQINE